MNDREAKLQRDALAAGELPPSSAQAALGMLSVPLRLVLGGVFLFAAWQKIGVGGEGASGKPQFFSESVKALWGKSLGKPLGVTLPDHVIQLITFGVPWVEVVASVLLIVGLWTRAAAAVIFAMLIGFTSMYIAVILRNEDVSCGCFGKSQLLCTGGVGWCHVGQNVTMAAMALVVMLTTRHVLAVDRGLSRRL